MKKATLLLLFLITSALSFAQNKGDVTMSGGATGFNKQEFRQRMQGFITKEASLTEEEAKAFFPIYNEYKDKQRQIHMSINKLKKNTPNSNDEKAYEKCLMEIARLNAEVAGLDSVYYKKICKAISAQKFYKILNIEDRMHRRMLQNYNRRQPARQGRR
ncbi:MAG: hypothetical protein UH687_06975 [Bacteroidaceae bacterium]|jgi:hypothetical protein|nr:hypothetical protein [Bacteroidaceae bacterium]